MIGAILAALGGGVGQGLGTYGRQSIREEEQEQARRQRIAEIEEQNAGRLRERTEAARMAQMAKDEENNEALETLRVLGIAPEGIRSARTAAPYLIQQQRDKSAQAKVESGRKGVFGALQQRGRIKADEQFNPDVDYPSVYRDVLNEDGQASRAALQAAGAANSAALAALRTGQGNNVRADRAAMTLTTQYDAAMKDRKATHDNLSGVLTMVPNALKGDGAAQTSVLYAFIKALDPESAVREGEVDLVRQSAPIMAKAQEYAKAMATGRSFVIPSQSINEMAAFIDKRMRSNAGRAETERTNFRLKARRFGVQDDEALFPGLGGAPPSARTYTPGNPYAGGNK